MGSGFARYARGFVMRTHSGRAMDSIVYIFAARLMLVAIMQADGIIYLNGMAFNSHGEIQSFNIPMSNGNMIRNFGLSQLI